MSPWKLSETEPTARFEISLPKSMKEWLFSQPRSASAVLRTLIKRAMTAEEKRTRDLTF
jgi:hypothetical protein